MPAHPARTARNSLRVLLINENLGGHATVHLSIQEALAEHKDIDARFLHLPARKSLRRLVGAPIPGLARLDLDLQPLRAQLAAAALARRNLASLIEAFDVVHVYTHNAALLSSKLLRGVPTVVTLDATNAQNAFRLPYREATKWTGRVLPATQWFERRVYDAATLIVANSRWAADSLFDDYAVPAGKVRVFPFGVPVAANLAISSSGGSAEDRLPRLTFVGRTMARKGGRQLLDVHQRHLSDRCVLTIVTEETVQGNLRNVEIRNDVRPGDGQLQSILATTDIFVFPSRIDMAPNAILEAMAAGLPVIALPMGAVPEMVVNGETGLLAGDGSDPALLAAITTLLDDPDGARRMGLAGHDRALELYDTIKSTDRLVQVLFEAIDLHGKSSRNHRKTPQARPETRNKQQLGRASGSEIP